MTNGSESWMTNDGPKMHKVKLTHEKMCGDSINSNEACKGVSFRWECKPGGAKGKTRQVWLPLRKNLNENKSRLDSISVGLCHLH